MQQSIAITKTVVDINGGLLGVGIDDLTLSGEGATGESGQDTVGLAGDEEVAPGGAGSELDHG